MNRKTILFLAILFISYSIFAQEKEKVVFDLNEIQVFDGLTNNDTHILKLDRNGILLRRIDILGDTNHKSDYINFRALEGNDLKEFRKNFSELIAFFDEFDYENYKPIKEKNETVIVEGDTLTREHLISTHDLGTRILIIDANFKSHFLRYFFCEAQLDRLIEKINNVIPTSYREEYQFRKRCD